MNVLTHKHRVTAKSRSQRVRPRTSSFSPCSGLDQKTSKKQLARALRKAARIAAQRAAEAKTEDQKRAHRSKRYLFAGLCLVMLGISGSSLAMVSGAAQTLGIFETTSLGILSVGLGAWIMTHAPESKGQSSQELTQRAQDLNKLSLAVRQTI